MAARLIGADALERRLRAIAGTPRAYSPRWAEQYVRSARDMVPVRTGETRGSIGVRSASERGAEIEGSRVAFFIDAGTRAHAEVPRRASRLVFPAGGRTVFARRVEHPATRARPFRRRALEEAWRLERLDEALVKLWNGAA